MDRAVTGVAHTLSVGLILRTVRPYCPAPFRYILWLYIVSILRKKWHSEQVSQGVKSAEVEEAAEYGLVENSAGSNVGSVTPSQLGRA